MCFLKILKSILIVNYIMTIYIWASLVAHMVKNLLAKPQTWVQSLGWKESMEEGMATHCSILAWRILKDKGTWRVTVHTTERLSTKHLYLDTIFNWLP